MALHHTSSAQTSVGPATNPWYRARGAATAGLVLLAALAIVSVQSRSLMAAGGTMTGQGIATPTVNDAVGHDDHGALPSNDPEGQMHMEEMAGMEHSTDSGLMAGVEHVTGTEHAGGMEHTGDMDHTGDTEHTSDMEHTADSEHMADADVEPLHAADTHDQESNAHGHGAEAVPVSASTRGLVLGGFGAVNGVVIVVAALLKIRIARTTKPKRTNRPDSTSGGVAQ